jgi:hypothetical protein
MDTSHTTTTTDSCVDTTHSSAISGWKDEVGNVAGVCTLHEAIIAGTGEFRGINIRTKTIEICLCNGANVVAQHGSKSRTRPKRIPRGGVPALYCFRAARRRVPWRLNHAIALTGGSRQSRVSILYQGFTGNY